MRAASCRALFALAVAALAAGCAERPIVVTTPALAAVAPSGKKAVGKTVSTLVNEDGRQVTVRKRAYLPDGKHYLEVDAPVFQLVLPGSMAQTGDGPLGDRVFRLDEHNLLEGCRWVAEGKVCQVATTPDGKALGGMIHFVVDGAGTATPRAGGWLAQGAYVPHRYESPKGKQLVMKEAKPILVGRAFHCRFADAGPRCIPVPIGENVGFSLLAAFSLRDGDKRREVVWLGDYGNIVAGAVSGPSPTLVIQQELLVKNVLRCETTEDSETVDCKPVAMK